MNILAFLKSPKIIGAALGVALVALSGWYVINLIEDNGRLESELSQSKTELANTKRTLENERERFSNTISNYDQVMSNYINSIDETEERSQQLQSTINKLSQENAELQQCFEMEAPDELLDELFGEEK